MDYCSRITKINDLKRLSFLQEITLIISRCYLRYALSGCFVLFLILKDQKIRGREFSEKIISKIA